MILKNKKTREISDFKIHKYAGTSDDGNPVYAPFNGNIDEWEDIPEEPITYYYISDFGAVREGDVGKFVEDEIARKEIGNYFSSREEAEKAVERLQAWKRLKDNGFKFIGKTYETDKRFGSIFYKVDENTYSEDIMPDLDLLFSQEGGDV